METFNAVFIVAVVVLVLVRQFTARPVRPVAFVVIALLIVRGCVPPGPAAPATAGITFLVTGLVLSAAAGVWRGATVPMWRDAGGTVLRRGNGTTAALWVFTLALRAGIAAVEYFTTHAPFNANALWLGAGVTLAAQQLVMLRRLPRIPAPAGYVR